MKTTCAHQIVFLFLEKYSSTLILLPRIFLRFRTCPEILREDCEKPNMGTNRFGSTAELQRSHFAPSVQLFSHIISCSCYEYNITLTLNKCSRLGRDCKKAGLFAMFSLPMLFVFPADDILNFFSSLFSRRSAHGFPSERSSVKFESCDRLHRAM